MSKFNVRTAKPAARGPVVTEATPSGRTHEGAPGYARDARSELFLLAVSNMVGEQTFYEKAGDRDDRYRNLVHQVAVEDPAWMLGFLRWLRSEGNMRSASLVGAAEFVKARLDAKAPSVPAYDVPGFSTDRGIERVAVDAVLQRADEPGELLAYWVSTYGRAIPKPVKRGVADAVQRLYTEFNLLKYDTASKGFRFADVIDLVHPSPKAPWQGVLFMQALERRHNRPPEIDRNLLPMLTANEELRTEAMGYPTALLDAERLNAAGMTWEDVLSLGGSKLDKRKLWEAVIPSMGFMACLRNLRNFDEAGVSDEVATAVAARLSDPEQVARSRQFPFRFLSAFKATSNLRWAHALEKALNASLSNVPEMPGRTLILVDVSGSMEARMSGRSELLRSEAAVVFGCAVAMRTEPTLVAFDHGSQRVAVQRGGSLLPLVRAFPRSGGGTNTVAAVQRWYAGHDRVLIVTDEQAHYDGYGDVTAPVPKHIPVYTWNLAGYRLGHAAGAANRHTFGGLADAAFRMVPLLEAGRNSAWPWLT